MKPRGNPKKDGQYKNYYRCHTCNQPGHFAWECTAETATANYSNARGNARGAAAQATGDHARKPRHRRGPKHKAKVVMEESEDEYAFYSGTGNDVSIDCGWIVDLEP